MKFVPMKPVTSNYIYLGNVKLDKGDNVLTRPQLEIVKAHPAYKYYCDKGLLVPSSQEEKPNGKERAIAKKEAEKKVETALKLELEPKPVEKPIEVVEPPKATTKRKRTTTKKVEEKSE